MKKYYSRTFPLIILSQMEEKNKTERTQKQLELKIKFLIAWVNIPKTAGSSCNWWPLWNICLLERMTSSVKSFATSASKTSSSMVPPKWLPKFECKSTRVKGLSFHPTRPWVAASMHNGAVQIWDYKLGVRIDSFEEHDGPVRSVVFHPTQPLLASAGDDHKIRLWDYKLRKCIHTFEGHSDYIRSVAFHHESPWLISASDDQTARIWNWQSRSCIAVITGHTHYIMCAVFHPSQDILATCSLDQTIRIWDMSGLRNKHSAAGRGFSSTSMDHSGSQFGMPSVDDKMNPDYYGPFDVVIKHVLEGHDRGVNWVSFHPTKPLLLSCSDDRLVKVWRINDSQAWELDSFRSHTNNVSCVQFVPSRDWIISDAEDKTIRVWDLNRKNLIFTQKKENDRFWALAVHPINDNMLAAGFDSGFVVFKLQSERPAMQINPDDGTFWYVKEQNLHHFSLQKGQPKDIISASLSGNKAAIQSIDICNQTKLGLISYWSAHEQAEIVAVSSGKQSSVANFKFPHSRAVFLSSSIVASYQPNSSNFSLISIGDLPSARNSDTLLKEFNNLPFSIKAIYQSNVEGFCLINAGGKLINFNLENGTVAAEVDANNNLPIKRVYWNAQKSCLCVLLKKSLYIFDSNLGMLSSVNENVSIKSAIWGEGGKAIYYSTSQHLKFILLNGDQGILRSLANVEYIGAASPGNLFCLDRQGHVSARSFEHSEVQLKIALNEKNFQQVASIISDCNLVGESIIAYLRKKGYAKIALSFVKEPASRFELALECGDLNAAVEACYKLDSPSSWELLGEEASKHGNIAIMEICYQKTNNFSKLVMLYTITGNSEKLQKLSAICHGSEEFSEAILCDLYLGQFEKSMKILEQAQLKAISYLACKSHGFNEDAAEFLTETGINPDEVEDFPVCNVEKRSNLVKTSSHVGWKINKVESAIDQLFQAKEFEIKQQFPDEQQERQSEDKFDYPVMEEEPSWDVVVPEYEHAGWEDDLSLPVEEEQPDFSHTSKPTLSFVEALKRRLSMNEIGQILEVKYSVTNIEPIIQLIHSYSDSGSLPVPQSEIDSKFASALALTTQGKFVDASKEFLNCLHLCLFSLDGAVSVVEECKDYLLGLKIESSRKDPQCSQTDSLRRAILFTLCNLQDNHHILSLRSAASLLYRSKNHKSCKFIAKRLLDLPIDESISASIKKILASCEKSPTDAIDLGIDYEPDNLSQISFICSKSFSPIFHSDIVSCPYCKAVAKEQFEDEVCSICELSLLSKQ